MKFRNNTYNCNFKANGSYFSAYIVTYIFSRDKMRYNKWNKAKIQSYKRNHKAESKLSVCVRRSF